MIGVIQRVKNASVEIDGVVKSSIQGGLLVLLGITHTDVQADVDWLAAKICCLRIFSDEEGKMNKSVVDISGEILCISQFTLLADYKKGNRPSFIKAAKPEVAIPLFNYFKQKISESQLKIESGIFGADMKVFLVNDGPVTIVLDSRTKV